MLFSFPIGNAELFWVAIAFLTWLADLAGIVRVEKPVRMQDLGTTKKIEDFIGATTQKSMAISALHLLGFSLLGGFLFITGSNGLVLAGMSASFFVLNLVVYRAISVHRGVVFCFVQTYEIANHFRNLSRQPTGEHES